MPTTDQALDLPDINGILDSPRKGATDDVEYHVLNSHTN